VVWQCWPVEQSCCTSAWIISLEAGECLRSWLVENGVTSRFTNSFMLLVSCTVWLTRCQYCSFQQPGGGSLVQTVLCEQLCLVANGVTGNAHKTCCNWRHMEVTYGEMSKPRFSSRILLACVQGCLDCLNATVKTSSLVQDSAGTVYKVALTA
jgi:hypothetical protein